MIADAAKSPGFPQSQLCHSVIGKVVPSCTQSTHNVSQKTNVSCFPRNRTLYGSGAPDLVEVITVLACF